MGARDIFYSEPELFGDQGVVDRFIDDIAHTCQVPRSALFVVGDADYRFFLLADLS